MFPASTQPSLGAVLSQLQNYAAGIKQQAAAAVIVIQSNNINTAYVFSMLDQLSGVITNLNAYKNVVGLNTYATANIPGYAGTLTSDITSVVNASQACIDWIISNFPKDTGGFIQAEKLNSDGTRIMSVFTPAQTVGLQTVLNALVASIS
ncbi:MAG TPA: hypothetical protein VGJ00_04085 [Rhabdochlamydiaceae bacterium]|jgi:hypothetical protein